MQVHFPQPKRNENDRDRLEERLAFRKLSPRKRIPHAVGIDRVGQGFAGNFEDKHMLCIAPLGQVCKDYVHKNNLTTTLNLNPILNLNPAHASAE